MHDAIERHVEDYLAGSGDVPAEFAAHLNHCNSCRFEVDEMLEQSELLRVLKAPADVEPTVGFYARVMERIESQRPTSIWSLFLDPIFGRRLATASLALALLMGVYLFSTEPGDDADTGSASMAKSIATTMTQTAMRPGEDGAGPTLGMGQERDRNAVLVDLASYREQ